MNRIVTGILQRVLVNYFYKVNSGFFLCCFFLLFGVIAPGQVISYHLSLIQGMITSPVFLSIVIFLWLLYTIKCINYTIKQLNEPRQLFLSCLQNIAPKQQLHYMLYVHIQIYMPVLVYAVIVLGVAVKQQYYGAAAATLLSNCLFILWGAVIYKRTLQRKESYFRLTIPSLSGKIVKPLFIIPVWFTWHSRKQMLLVTKLFSLLLLYGFIHLYEPEKHDIRPLLLIMMLIAAAHCVIVFQVRLFEEEFLSFSRNLPVPVLKRFGGLFVSFIILLLPELLFSVQAYPLHFQVADIPQLILLPVSMLVFFYSVLLMEDIDTDSYLRIIFIICAVLFFVILYNPGPLLSISILGVAMILFTSHCNDFEKKAGVNP